MKVIYPYDTPHGREIVTPFHFQKPVSMDLADAERLLGRAIKPQEAEAALRRMGLQAERQGKTFTVTPPPYRNDFLHPVDVVEEIMIGCGHGELRAGLARGLHRGPARRRSGFSAAGCATCWWAWATRR